MPHHSALTSQLADAYIADRRRSTNRSSQTPTRRRAEPTAHRFPDVGGSFGGWAFMPLVLPPLSLPRVHDTPSRPSSAKVRRVGSHVPANRTVST
jgi:hypothetical protein